MKKFFICMIAVMLLIPAAAGCAQFAGGDLNSASGSITTPTPSAGSLTNSAVPSGSAAQASASPTIGPAEATEAAAQVDANSMIMTVYYADKDGFVLPVTRKFQRQEAMARAALTSMTDSETTRSELSPYGLVPVIPAGTKILGINIKDSTAYVDFSNDILGYADKKAEVAMISAIVYTLTEFISIDNVVIEVNGKTGVELDHGSNISAPLNRLNTLINAPELNLGAESAKTDLYFYKAVNDNFTYALPVSAVHPVWADARDAKSIVGIFTSLTRDAALISYVPEGLAANSATISGETLSVDFDQQLKMMQGIKDDELKMLRQLVYTFNQLSELKYFKISVNGSNETLPMGTDISKPLALEQSRINAFMI